LNLVGDTSILVGFLFSLLIGSLLPDADCGGRATLYYKFPIIDDFMKKVVGKSIIFIFGYLISKKKIETEHEVNDEHRGIMHSPIGVLVSSILLIIPIFIFALVFDMFNPIILLTILFGFIIGQLLHLFEDSCTVKGINWSFPFKTKELSGKIYTFSRDPEKRDIRPIVYAGIFYLLTGLLAIAYSFNLIDGINIFLIYFLILAYDILAFFLIIGLSKKEDTHWMFKKNTINQAKKGLRKIERMRMV
jgi:membrane-bound metal-dependent hydrolase YbcI (DUF457 family)